MISILCPHCQTKLTVEEQWRGKTINCLSCGQKLAIAVAGPTTNVAESAPSLVIAPRPTSGARRRKRPVGNRVITAALHLSITVATVCGGYYLLTQQRANVPPPQVTVAKQPQTPKATKPEHTPRTRSRPVEESDPVQTIPIEPLPPVEAIVPVISPFKDFPAQVALPSSGDSAIVSLADGLTDVDFRFVSNSPTLTHSDRKIFWQEKDSNPAAVAGLAMIDGGLKFRWLATVPPAAEAAVRNSIVRLSADDFQHSFALRRMEFTEPLQINLNKASQKIICKCDCMPDARDICFELAGIDELPATMIDGIDPAHLQLREQTTLQYVTAAGAATRLKMKKRGKLVAIELESRYALPSGNEQSMTIARGNSQLKELTSLQQEATAASSAISNLRSQLKNLQSEARAVPRSRATATAKSIKLANLNQSIGATQQKIQYAERLISQKSAIEADYQALQQIAGLAQQLHETKLAYRFFTVVDGHEVDLLLSR